MILAGFAAPHVPRGRPRPGDGVRGPAAAPVPPRSRDALPAPAWSSRKSCSISRAGTSSTMIRTGGCPPCTGISGGRSPGSSPPRSTWWCRTRRTGGRDTGAETRIRGRRPRGTRRPARFRSSSRRRPGSFPRPAGSPSSCRTPGSPRSNRARRRRGCAWSPCGWCTPGTARRRPEALCCVARGERGVPRLLPPLVLHGGPEKYCPEVERICRLFRAG